MAIFLNLGDYSKNYRYFQICFQSYFVIVYFQNDFNDERQMNYQSSLFIDDFIIY